MSLIRFHPVILGKGRGPGILRGNGQPGHTSIADLIKYTLCLFRRHFRYYHMSDTTITETIYVVKDRDGNCRYVGRTRLPLARRLQKHSEQLRTDWLACPLYRFMHQENATFNQDDWTIEPLATVAFPDAQLYLCQAPRLRAHSGQT